MSAETMSVVRTPASVFRAWRRRSRDQDKDLTPLPWLRAAFAVLIVVVGGGAVALWLTSRWAEQHIAGVAATDAPLVSVRLDAIKTGLTVAAGLGAGVTLLLALRRQAISERAQRTAERAQRHVELAAERSHELAEKDAAERRITELYVAAVQQLGSDKAPVRLGGLYAMERIGNDYPKMRQTIMDVWCAYLRMPYAPPAEVLPDDGLSLPHPVAQNHVASDPEQASRRQERNVSSLVRRSVSGFVE